MFTEDQLVKCVAGGDRKAIRYLINEYQNYIYTISYSVLKTKHESEEATQDTFMKIIRALPSYVKQSKLTTWMYSIAYRTALDYLKKRKGTKDLNGYEHGEPPEIEARIASSEKSRSIKTLLSELPSQDAILVRMYYLDEMSIKELSQIIGLSESNVKIRLYRARKALAAIVKRNKIYSELINP